MTDQNTDILVRQKRMDDAKIKPGRPGLSLSYGRPDPDAATGCADDQVFATVPAELLRRIADA